MIDLFELKNPETFAKQLTLKTYTGGSVREHVSKHAKALELFVLYITNAGIEDWRESVTTEWITAVITHLVKAKLMDTECDICGKFAMESIDVIDPDQGDNL